MTRLYHRRFPAAEVYTTVQARELALLSRVLSRQIGLLIDRKGRVQTVIVGEAGSLYIPELPRGRSSAERLRGLRLLHTHLSPDGINQEDLMDMLFLRLDAVVVLTVSALGEPMQWQGAHLLPQTLSQAEAGQSHHVEPFRPWDQTNASFAAIAVALEEEFARNGDGVSTASEKPRALLISVGTPSRVLQERNLDELAELAHTVGLDVAGRIVQRVAQVNPRSILGKGKMAELEVLALQGNASLLVFDGELSPAQLHTLSDITERKVIDRTQLILDIFAQHAQSRAGKLQVELAQLRYTLPRLAGKNRAMDRLMGGIGGRGPGETKLETDRRKLRERMTHIRKDLERLRQQRAFIRSRRSRVGIPLAALIGYTNAGKSTLLNKLTRSSVLTENKLFATLDPTTRRLRFPSEREIILADTVGFIRNLPQELMDAFHATLEELESADLFIHVADAAHEDMQQQINAVEAILEDMQLHHVPRVLVLNKWDLLNAAARDDLAEAFPHALAISASNGSGCTILLEELDRRLLSASHLRGA